VSWRPKLLRLASREGLEEFEAEKVDRLVRDFEADLGLIPVHRLADAAARRGLVGGVICGGCRGLM